MVAGGSRPMSPFWARSPTSDQVSPLILRRSVGHDNPLEDERAEYEYYTSDRVPLLIIFNVRYVEKSPL